MRVRLKGTYGYGRPRVYYGPGVVDVPDGLARALGLSEIPAGALEGAPPPAAEPVFTPAPALEEAVNEAPKRRGRKAAK